MSILIKFVFISVIILAATSSFAQEKTGFGCIGFVGGFAGYEVKNFEAQGLNQYIKSFNSANSANLTQKAGNFGQTTGFRVGINLLRQNFAGVMITMKGFYSSLSEKQETNITTSTGFDNYSFDLKLNLFGVGFEFGKNLTSALSLKVVTVDFSYSLARFSISATEPRNNPYKERVNEGQAALGINVGSGFILFVIDKYISIEGQAGYSFIKFPTVVNSEGKTLTEYKNSNIPINDFISGGGFSAVLQMNVAFPL